MMKIRIALVALMLLPAAAMCQTWTGSGSNGSDGPLEIGNNTPGVVNGVYTFNPVLLNLDADGDNIFHFTTVTISDNVQVDFDSALMRNPGAVVWLCSGAVNINGRLNLTGEVGHPAGSNISLRKYSKPGPGGFPGGLGRLTGAVESPATAGFGPGGAKVPADGNRGCPASHAGNATTAHCAEVATPPIYGSSAIQPLIGGSGGSGATNLQSGLTVSSGGAGGGGAIRIASSVHIAFGTGVGANFSPQNCGGHQYIIADGGAANTYGGAGSGGAIHLQAPVVVGCATHLYARGGSYHVDWVGTAYAGDGRLRIDANSNVGVSGAPAALTGPLSNVPIPVNPARIRIQSVNGIDTPVQPTGSVSIPDISTNSTGAIPVVVNAAYIPVNTPITLHLTPDVGADITVPATLTGTLAASTATVNVTLPQGISRLLVRAVW